HIQAFAEALQSDDFVHELQGDSTSASSPTIPTPNISRVRKVSALSDFAPVNLRVRRKSKKERRQEKKTDWLFLILRWPLLILIFLIIAAEFGLYVVIRQLVNTKEWFTAWSGRKGLLRKNLRAAQSYEEWKTAATTLDQYLQFDEWKRIDEDAFYDWKLVRKVKRSLKSLRTKKDARGCIGVLETCMRSNFAGLESARLYSETYLGTKDLIESYYDEQEKTLEYIRDTPDLSIDEKKKFFKSANTNLGISALCLSGGASFGYYHVGVARAFLDANLLPRVVTGTSAGGLIAALVCTRTDDELRALLAPQLALRITACEEPFSVWLRRFWSTGARFDSVIWARKCSWFTRGSMTFKEAYLRTGRVLNISVIPADRHSPTKVLNYMTAPDTVIWSALLASAAVPGILNPVVLMQKLKDGSIIPWNWGSRFKDGSLRVDIPVQALNLYFNVTHPIVSQVNPHVHLFFFAPRGSAGRPVAHRKGKGKGDVGWRGNFLLSAAEQWLKHELTKNFKVIRDLELLPQLLGQDWSSVFLQRFDGAVTIWPKTRAWDWVRILTDPDPPELTRMIRVGQVVTWPKLHMIENRMRIEKQILLGRQTVRKLSKIRTTRGTPADSRRSPLGDNPEHPALDPQLPPRSESPQATGSDHPLSVDTDAELAFANGSRWFFKRAHSSASLLSSGTATPRDPRLDPLRSATMRRKWASELRHSPVQEDDSQQAQPTEKPRSNSFFARLKSASFSSLPFQQVNSPVAQLQPGGGDDDEDAWSTDSSSDEDLWPEDVSNRSSQRSTRVFPSFED
ncbi:patatin-domain-containing protein, partial [Pluteus cervinus]